ncbi:tryptophanyl-tRNA synthetase [Nematocida homosporus]|uniref:tryptophanyl-tRNA synthetase n=1 Tax=Nematocida homosporus TaxID=1912981 RepID=UPI00221E4A9A|nr:tryptophanyl-tRNA synthetase [Nematocida homosporus]KAI5186897.1 tryptophanyl-tRNA synthetase [Nematocida homosporus]
MDDNTNQTITPWEITSSKVEEEIDYSKIIDQFGCQPFSVDMARKHELDHILFRRGLVFAHRDFIATIEAARKGEEIYLYTGRGPSSTSMHLGHAVPFLLCKYLQDKFGCNLVIQMTDDEKYIWKDITLEESVRYGRENAKDIAAFGFDPKKTFIFSNVNYAHRFVANTLKIEKSIMLKDFIKVFGFTDSVKVGQVCFPSKQMAPCYPSSFPELLNKNARCLIPCSIDQDPYFRLARDIANKLNAVKPATVYTYFLPALQGMGTKMSASSTSSSIYLNDTPAEIKKKINKHAFSGGRDTLEEHRRLGGNPTVDVAYQYLRFFLSDDALLKQYEEGYKNGTIMSGEMKKLCIATVQEFIKEFQATRAGITEEKLDEFYAINK